MPNFLPRSHAYDISVTLASAGKWGEQMGKKTTLEKVVTGDRDVGRVRDPASPDFSKVTPSIGTTVFPGGEARISMIK